MIKKTLLNSKPILLKDEEAVQFVKIRALKERRSAQNALTATVIEALKDRFGGDCTLSTSEAQERFPGIIPGGR